jgi:hypothetical protein
MQKRPALRGVVVQHTLVTLVHPCAAARRRRARPETAPTAQAGLQRALEL